MYADAALAAKLTFEADLARPLAQVCSAYLSYWAQNQGTVPPLDRVGYQDQIARLLTRHYARVIQGMTGRPIDDDPPIEAVTLSLAHGDRLRYRAQNQSAHIMRGLERDLYQAMIEVELGKGFDPVDETKDDKPSMTMSVVGKMKTTVERAFRKLKRRIRGMVNYETEAVAEEAVFEFVKNEEKNARIVKIWNSLLDGKERETHHMAHGQRVYVDQAFEVGGAKMMFPGDPSLGAPIRETINCRCYSEFYAEAPDGSAAKIPLRTPLLPAKRRWREGDRFGIETPVRATSRVTLNGRTRARIVLGDGRTFANLNQTTPDTITVTVGGKDVARATHSNGRVATFQIAPGYENQGIENLIRRSVEESHRYHSNRPPQ